MELKVECQKREPELNSLRRSGLILRICTVIRYRVIALTLNAKTAETLLKQASNNTLIQLNILNCAGVAKPLREVQTHPAKGSALPPQLFAVAGKTASMLRLPSSLWETLVCKLEGGY